MNYWFYIVENVFSANLSDKGLTTRIMKIPEEVIVCKIKEGDGPYHSIRNLKRNSKIFQNFRKKGSTQVEKLLNDKNIVKVTDVIFTPSNRGYSPSFIKLINHTMGGQIRNKTVYGIHFYERERVRILELIGNENKDGVWEAIIEAYDRVSNQWIKKDKVTTFFPIKWSANQLFHECDYAYENREKVDNKTNVFSSKTLSGVKVEIIIENNEVKTIYPLMD